MKKTMPENDSGEFHPVPCEQDLQLSGDPNKLKTKNNWLRGSSAKSAKADRQLCHDCSKFDFQVASTSDSDSYAIFIADVGQRFRTPPQNADCLLCSMLYRSRITKVQYKSEPSGRDELRAFQVSQHGYRAEMARLDRREIGYRILLIIPEGTDVLDSYTLRVISEHAETHECAILQQDVPGKTVSACPCATKFDPGKALSWIEYCDRNHTTLCLPSKSEGHWIKLLNCDTLAMEEATNESRYVALSYVWGQSNPITDYMVRDGNGLRVLLPKSPKVIVDAISVTKSLGYRYLWIDKLCIDQRNETEKHQQIQQMDAIYEKAQLTIIAAAGDDENHGFPGVTSERPLWPEKIPVGDDLSITWTPKDPHGAIRKSVWSTRGWTFQEAVLSRRRLAFLEDQVYFECNAMNCYESIVSPLDSLHVGNRRHMKDSLRAGVFDRNKSNPVGIFDPDSMSIHELFLWYFSSIEEYTKRTLRFDSDSCNAFAGVMRRFAGRKQPIYEVWGLPYLVDGTSDEKVAFFAHSLAWFHPSDQSDVACRRPAFPSWSWSGWCGRAWNAGERGTESPICRLELENPANGEVTPLSSLRENTDHGHSPYRILSMTTLVVPISLLTYWDHEELKSRFWEFAGNEAKFDFSERSLVEPCMSEDISNGKIDQWRFALLERGWYLNWMVLRKNLSTDNWVRVGLCSIHQDTYDISIREGSMESLRIE